MAVTEKLLTTALKPTELKQIILTKRVKALIGNSTDLKQNYIFEGSPGIGKTSLARILANGRPTLYINASEERGIDTIRETVTQFCATVDTTIEDYDYKVVIFDEMDGAGDLFFKSLRATMEKYSFKVRFIATCNYLSTIPDPIKSRFTNIVSFNPVDGEEEIELKKLYIKRIKSVCKQLEIEWESDLVLEEFLNRNFPDLRSIFGKIQNFQIQGLEVITMDKVSKSNYEDLELFERIMKETDSKAMFDFIISNYAAKVTDTFVTLNKEFPKFLQDNHPDKLMLLPKLCKSIVEWEYRSNFISDKVTGLLASIYDIQQIISGK